MKAVLCLVFLGLVALSTAGFISSYAVPAPAVAHYYAASPIAYTATYNTLANYRLGLDTSLPGSAYASYPNAAAPTAYGYGVIKTL